MLRDVTCYGRVAGRGWTQEHYETASKDAGVRAAELRKQGYQVGVECLGMQVTSVGYVRMTMVTIRHPQGDAPDAPARVERL